MGKIEKQLVELTKLLKTLDSETKKQLNEHPELFDEFMRKIQEIRNGINPKQSND